MKRYINRETKEVINEGQSIIRQVDWGIFAGVPTEEQLLEWGFEEFIIPQPTEAQVRMRQIKKELREMDYLTSKYIDGEDMSEYGDWQAKRKALREEYRQLEEAQQS